MYFKRGTYLISFNIFLLLQYLRANNGVTLAGWGAMKKLGNTSSKVQHTSLNIKPQMLCNNSYSSISSANPFNIQIEMLLPDLFQSNIMCAGSNVSM